MEKRFLESVPVNKDSNIEPEKETGSSSVEAEDILIYQEKVELLKEKIELVVDNVNNLKPEKISPDWLKNSSSKEYYAVKDKFRTLEGGINWKLFADFLPKDIQAIWSYEEQRKWTEKKAQETVLKLLRKDQPTTFNAHWIRKADYGLYRHLRKKLKSKETNEIEWEKFIDKLPEEWQERWVRGFRKEEKIKMSERRRVYTFDKAIKKLNEILEEKKPAHFSSTDIGRYDKQLYSFFRENVKRKQGGIDWDKIIKGIDEEYKNRFRPPKRFEDEYPKNIYENEQEVEEIIESNKEGLMGFFGGNREKRNELCFDLVKLAKKGNINAEEKLIQYLEMVALSWIEKDRMFKIYEMDIDGLQERIRRCIYLYRDYQTTSFVGYVYVNLREEAKGKKFKRIRLDQHSQSDKDRGGRGRDGHETIDLSQSLMN